ncbi:MAG: MopE-related protein [Myxococcota bacterium]
MPLCWEFKLQQPVLRTMQSCLGLLSLVFACSACAQLKPNLEDLPCDDGRCVEGYVCHPEKDICAPAVVINCDGTGVCPTEIETGAPCPSVNSFVSCTDGASDCSEGCRTCRTDLTWSPCSGEPETCVPSGEEICDNTDNDCNGVVDDVEPAALNIACQVVFPDAHAESFVCTAGTCVPQECSPGFHNIDTSVGDCEYACTPTNGGVEICDGIDNDCDGNGDTMVTWYNDKDGDSFTNGVFTQQACDDPDGAGTVWVPTPTLSDCDDDPSGCGANCFPGNSTVDVCDGFDQNCDGFDGEGDGTSWYHDADGDGYTSATDIANACADPDGAGTAWLAAPTALTDCDDTPARCGALCFPNNAGPDICDGYDQDCDTQIDENPNITWFHDNDGDGFTNNADTQVACVDPDGTGTAWVNAPSSLSDCDDNPATCGQGCFPGNSASDICDGYNQDCDASVDEDGGTTWYHDKDGDGYTDNTDTQVACADPDGVGINWLGSPTALDCDDNDAASNPGAAGFATKRQ